MDSARASSSKLTTLKLPNLTDERDHDHDRAERKLKKKEEKKKKKEKQLAQQSDSAAVNTPSIGLFTSQGTTTDTQAFDEAQPASTARHVAAESNVETNQDAHTSERKSKKEKHKKRKHQEDQAAEGAASSSGVNGDTVLAEATAGHAGERDGNEVAEPNAKRTKLDKKLRKAEKKRLAAEAEVEASRQAGPSSSEAIVPTSSALVEDSGNSAKPDGATSLDRQSQKEQERELRRAARKDQKKQARRAHRDHLAVLEMEARERAEALAQMELAKQRAAEAQQKRLEDQNAQAKRSRSSATDNFLSTDIPMAMPKNSAGRRTGSGKNVGFASDVKGGAPPGASTSVFANRSQPVGIMRSVEAGPSRRDQQDAYSNKRKTASEIDLTIEDDDSEHETKRRAKDKDLSESRAERKARKQAERSRRSQAPSVATVDDIERKAHSKKHKIDKKQLSEKARGKQRAAPDSDSGDEESDAGDDVVESAGDKSRDSKSGSKASKKGGKDSSKVPTVTDTTKMDHEDLAEHFATKWLSHKELRALAEAKNFEYRQGKFSIMENNRIRTHLEKYREIHGLSEAELSAMIASSSNKEAGSGIILRDTFWPDVARAVGGGRALASVWNHVRRMYDDTAGMGPWTPAEDEKLRAARAEHGTAWTKIGTIVGRNGTDCKDRYTKHLCPAIPTSKVKRGAWTEAEIAKLRNFLTEKGTLWSILEKEMEGRTASQCRHKWQSLVQIEGAANAVQALAGSAPPDLPSGSSDPAWYGKYRSNLVAAVTSQLARGPPSQISWTEVRGYDNLLERYSERTLSDKWIGLVETANRELRASKTDVNRETLIDWLKATYSTPFVSKRVRRTESLSQATVVDSDSEDSDTENATLPASSPARMQVNQHKTQGSDKPASASSTVVPPRVSASRQPFTTTGKTVGRPVSSSSEESGSDSGPASDSDSDSDD